MQPCQVTFSKRIRSSLIKKAHEISVLCNVDVALLAFSPPSGRLSKFCSRTRLEDVFQLYITQPAEKRYHYIKNVEVKMDKLKLIGYIKGEENMKLFLDNHSKLREGKLQEIAGQNGGKSTAKGAYGYVSNTFRSNFPTTSFQPIQECGLSSFIPQASSLTNYINYASVQEKPGYDAGSYRYHQYPAETLGNQWSFQKQSNQIGHSGVIPSQANNVNWSFCGNYNTNHNMSSPQPSSSQSSVTMPGGNPFFTTSVITTTKISDKYIMNNQTSDSDTVDKLAATEQMNPPEQPLTKTFLPDYPSTLAVEATSETNKDCDSWEWDGFALAETLNYEDLDIVF